MREESNSSIKKWSIRVQVDEFPFFRSKIDFRRNLLHLVYENASVFVRFEFSSISIIQRTLKPFF